VKKSTSKSPRTRRKKALRPQRLCGEKKAPQSRKERKEKKLCAHSVSAVNNIRKE
jgi:hypothetical protein